MDCMEIRDGMEVEGIHTQLADVRNTSNVQPALSANEKRVQPDETGAVIVEKFERRLYSMNGFKYELNRHQMDTIVAMLKKCLAG